MKPTKTAPWDQPGFRFFTDDMRAWLSGHTTDVERQQAAMQALRDAKLERERERRREQSKRRYARARGEVTE